MVFYSRANAVLGTDALEHACDRNPTLVGLKDGVGGIEQMTRIFARMGDRLVYVGGLPTAEVFALRAAVPIDHPLATVKDPLGPEGFDGVPVISYHPVTARYFHDMTVRFLVNGHSRIEQHVQQILTALLLVAAGEGVAFVPGSSALLGVPGVAWKSLNDFGGGDPSRPVELHVIWARGTLTPMLRRVLNLVQRCADEFGGDPLPAQGPLHRRDSTSVS